MPTANDFVWMRRALALAEEAAAHNEVPVGAVVVRNNVVIGEGWNQPIESCDPSGHAEIVALRKAAKQENNYRLPDSTLYVTIEPCTMCLGTIVHARVGRVVFGAREPKAGVLISNPALVNSGFFNHHFCWEGGVCEAECTELMTTFFVERRKKKKMLKNK